MTEMRYFAVKISDRLDLETISEVFKVNRTLKWKNSLRIDSELVSTVLKQHVSKQEVYIYSFGVLTFLNFSEVSIRIFMDFMSQIQPVHYDDFAKYYDHYEAQIGDYGEWFVKDNLTIPIKTMNQHIADTVAKSAGLAHMEAQLERVIDSVEPMLLKLGKGKSRIDSRTMAIISETIVFKYKLTQNLQLFEKPETSKLSGNGVIAYKWLANYFEFDERYQINAQKIESLKHMVYQYYHFNQTRKIKSLYVFEVFLLMLFPLTRILGSYFETLKAYFWLIK